jgi:hypothetical protein
MMPAKAQKKTGADPRMNRTTQGNKDKKLHSSLP